MLISRVQALLHDGRLKIHKRLPDAPALVAELQDFRAKVTDSGYWKFGARSGKHDDLGSQWRSRCGVRTETTFRATAFLNTTGAWRPHIRRLGWPLPAARRQAASLHFHGVCGRRRRAAIRQG